MGRSSLGKAAISGARTTADQAGGASRIKRRNPSAGSGSSTGEAAQGLVGESAKKIVALEKKVNEGTASKAEIAELKKLETANEEATRRATVRASETRRNRKGVMPTKPEEPKDAVATYMKTGEKLEGFTPTPRQVEQRKRNVAARGATGKKAGGKVMKRKAGGKVRDTKNAKPKDKPAIPDSTKYGKGATRGSEDAKMVPAKKMGGGQVMKYKKGGMVYKKHGGVVKAASGGDSLIASCYD